MLLVVFTGEYSTKTVGEKRCFFSFHHLGLPLAVENVHVLTLAT